jgi:hypothetical protein
MSENQFRSPEHWLQRAKDAWNHVEHMRAAHAQRQMIEIAESYERMAQRARKRQERGEDLLAPHLAPKGREKQQTGLR